jgi:putative phosphoribosyl transferase
MFQDSVRIPVDKNIRLDGDLTIPDNSQGIVVFAHGSGSSRHSPRNQFVAKVLSDAGLATLLMDLLTVEEEEADDRTRLLRFDIGLLARRLSATMDWLVANGGTVNLRLGLFGASTGAAAALVAAGLRPTRVEAIVSRGGRPDLAGNTLSKVRAPTLLIVGGKDEMVMNLNRKALLSLETLKALKIVPGATHMFEEPGALEQVAFLARGWFIQHLSGVRERTS